MAWTSKYCKKGMKALDPEKSEYYKFLGLEQAGKIKKEKYWKELYRKWKSG